MLLDLQGWRKELEQVPRFLPWQKDCISSHRALLSSQVKFSLCGDLRLSVWVLRITSTREYSRFCRLRRWRNCLENETSVLKKRIIISPLYFILSYYHHDHYNRCTDIHSFTDDYPVKHWIMIIWIRRQSKHFISISLGFCSICGF